ncbi:hypothetical protein ANCDUO_11196, partial [Ancylostoma duodenale]
MEVEILEFCLYAHASRTEVTKQFHDHLVDGFYEHKQYVEDKFGRTRSILPPGASVQYSVESNGIAPKKTISSNSLDAGTASLDQIRNQILCSCLQMLILKTCQSQRNIKFALAWGCNRFDNAKYALSIKKVKHANFWIRCHIISNIVRKDFRLCAFVRLTLCYRANSRTTSERFDAARVFATMRNSSMDSLKSPARASRRPTMEGIEGIRLRSRVRKSVDQSTGAPPLPPRTHIAKMSYTPANDKNNSTEHRHAR